MVKKYLIGALISIATLGVSAVALANDENPDVAKTYYNRGTAEYNQGNFKAAARDLSKTIALEPKAPDAYFNRGLSLRRQHKIDESISDFTQAIKLNQTQAGYYFERGNALIVKGDYENAIKDASEAIRLSPQEPQGYFLRGLAFMLSGNFDKALADSLKAVGIEPEYADARRLLGETLIKMDKQKSLLPIHSDQLILERKGIANMSKDFRKMSD